MEPKLMGAKRPRAGVATGVCIYVRVEHNCLIGHNPVTLIVLKLYVDRLE